MNGKTVKKESFLLSSYKYHNTTKQIKNKSFIYQ